MASDVPLMRRRRSIVGPLLLILLGAILLLQNFGVLPWGIWNEIWRFWPVVLILLGVEVLLGRSSISGAIVFAVLIAIAAAVLGFSNWWAAGIFSSDWWWSGSPAVTDQVDQPRADATHVTYRIENGAGRLVLGALPSGDSRLYSGSVTHGGRLEQEVTGTTDVRVALRASGAGPIPGRLSFGSDWELTLSSDVPADLRVQTGAGESNLDLTNLRIQRLDLDTGAGRTSVTLPREGFDSGQINGGVGEVTIRVPDGLAVRIDVSQGLGAVDVDQSRFVRTDAGWETRDFATATTRAQLFVKSGVGALRIQ